jgi:glycosyltransferase involved in cell wall biosynthesis
MRITHLLAPGDAGGLESVVRMLALGQLARGHPVQVVATRERGASGSPWLEELRAGGVLVLELRLPGRAYVRESREIRAAFLAFRPDVVHTHGYRSDVIGGWVARRLKVRTVSTVHGFTGGGWKNRLYERIQMTAFRRCDAVIAVSRPLFGSLEAAGVPSSRLVLLPNAFAPDHLLSRVEAREVLGLPADTPIIGWVGRLGREKGADVIIRALPALMDLPLQVSFLGDGAERSRLELLARELGVTPRIRWHGVIPGAGRLARAFDLFVLSSRTEGTPIALFEAMGAGTPVVATAVGGVPDVISPEQGWLVPSDDPVQLAAAIREAWSDPDLRRAKSEAASRRLAEYFDPGSWLDHHERLYRTLAGVPGRETGGMRSAANR